MSPAKRFPQSDLTRRTQLVELLVFLFLILPSLVLSAFVVRQGKMSFILDAALAAVYLWRGSLVALRLPRLAEISIFF